MYFRASIMNPFLVYSLSIDYFKKSKKVLTPCLGWSSYLLGFMQNKNLQHYVGIDVIKKVCSITKKLATYYRPDIKCDIYCSPSEDLYIDNKFWLSKLAVSKSNDLFSNVFMKIYKS